MQNAKHKRIQTQRAGFTLIEVMVAISIFVIVVTIGISSLIAANNAYQKSQSQRIALDNLNFAIETMTRQIRTGNTYHCGSAPYTTPMDCGSGSTFAFVSAEGNQIVYTLDNGVIYRGASNVSGGDLLPITSENITINRLLFVTQGAVGSPDDDRQPRVTILLEGIAVEGVEETSFSLQTTISQRALDA